VEQVRRGLVMGLKYACKWPCTEFLRSLVHFLGKNEWCASVQILSKPGQNSFFGQKYPKKRVLSDLDRILSKTGIIDTVWTEIL
jgi:hypothetical protein